MIINNYFKSDLITNNMLNQQLLNLKYIHLIYYDFLYLVFLSSFLQVLNVNTEFDLDINTLNYNLYNVSNLHDT